VFPWGFIVLELLKRYRKALLILALPYLFVVLSMAVRIDYRVSTPGDLSPIAEFFELEEAQTYPQENPFYSVYVMSIDRPTMFQYALGSVFPSLSVSELPPSREHISDRANFESGQVARRASLSASLIASLEREGYEVDYEERTVLYLIYDYAVHDGLQIGDHIVRVNGDENVVAAAKDAACGEHHEFEILRGEERRTHSAYKAERDGECTFGFIFRSEEIIIDIEIPYTVKETLIGGPSGGLMQALYVYNAVTEVDLSAGYTIAGTGTIDKDGNVGNVGGVREKVITANRRNVDVFFVPYRETNTQNYDTAVATKEKFGYTLDIVGVETLSEAVNYLLSLQGGENDE